MAAEALKGLVDSSWDLQDALDPSVDDESTIFANSDKFCCEESVKNPQICFT